jgi:hypothetical protein
MCFGLDLSASSSLLLPFT